MDSDGTWSTKLSIATFASNTTIKRATHFSAFELMFGRKCDPAKLIKLTNKSYVKSEELDEKLSDEEVPREINDTFDGPLDSVNDAMRELQKVRTQNQTDARMYVKIEQSRQKKIYDQKVQDNR